MKIKEIVKKTFNSSIFIGLDEGYIQNEINKDEVLITVTKTFYFKKNNT